MVGGEVWSVSPCSFLPSSTGPTLSSCGLLEWARMICLLSRASFHRAAGNSSSRHTDKRHPGSGSRMKLSCLNLSLKSQPELFRCFHSASGRGSTRKVRVEETGGCLRAEGRGQRVELLPSRELHKAPLPPLATPGLQYPVGHCVLGALPRSWHTALAVSSETHYSCCIELVHIARGTTHLWVTQGNKDPYLWLTQGTLRIGA